MRGPRPEPTSKQRRAHEHTRTHFLWSSGCVYHSAGLDVIGLALVPPMSFQRAHFVYVQVTRSRGRARRIRKFGGPWMNDLSKKKKKKTFRGSFSVQSALCFRARLDTSPGCSTERARHPLVGNSWLVGLAKRNAFVGNLLV